MAESSIPVDLLNPGQVFACLGILEASEALMGDATAAFDWTDGPEPTFRVSARGEEPPVDRVLRFLGRAEVTVRAPNGSSSLDKWKPDWGATAFDSAGVPFPFRDPGKHDVLPAVLRGPAGEEITVEYWGDTTRRDNVKFWGGSGGYPGAALMRDAVGLAADAAITRQTADPFSVAAPQSSSFRFDWRRDYIPVRDGFSVNRHRGIQMVGFPLVEVLAAIGVTHARPRRYTKLEYRYGVVGQDERRLLLEAAFHRAALGLDSPPVPGLPFRRFVMRLDWPGKAGQARSITQVHEENAVV